MHQSKLIWTIGGIFIVIVAGLIFFIWAPFSQGNDDPWANVPARLPHTNHANLLEGPFETGSDVTRACLECHEEAAEQVTHTAHWTWESEPVQLPGRAEPVTVGKKNSINNFCIGIQGNWPSCTSCHAGYGWEDASFDFNNEENVDCLVCHDTSGGYAKGKAGQPAEGVDLLAVAQSVGNTNRETCGGCHFKGGGGDAVKHGDLDTSLSFPTENIDVHMGQHDFVCTDCHQTEQHQVKGRSISVSLDDANQVYCTDCHNEQLHQDERLNAHTATVACQTCHIPQGAVKEATKMHWDWSTAGQDREDDPHEYLKIKGSFIYEKDFTPEYYWYNGTADRYLLGDPINLLGPTAINLPRGDLADPTAKIWPFKVHRAKQIYDTSFNYLLQPKTAGEGGYWEDFDWDQAARLGSEAVGMEYSGNYGFTETEMYWPLSHMIAPTEAALQCDDCHSATGRLDWSALGYDGDPLNRGGRQQNLSMRSGEGQ